jgi:cytoskeleton protein RodZ
MDDEQLVATDGPTVGERLRAAREEKGLSLEDLAAQTRIPQRHLESLETGDWDKLPHPTYTTGFAKSYASAVGLDRAEIGEQLRAEMGGERTTATTAEVFEPADPARTMPKSLVFGAIAAVILLVVLMTWLNERSLSEGEDTNSAPAPTQPAQPAQRPAAQPAAAPAAQGAVVLTATEPVWIQVTDQGKTLFSGQLGAGQSFTVPPTATAPLLKAGKPEALKITVGTTVAPPVGPAGKVASNVSLLPADLLRAGQQPAAPAPSAVAPPAPAPKPRAVAPRPAAPKATAPAPAPPPASQPPPPATNTTGE